jgi:hypothetical protein
VRALPAQVRDAAQWWRGREGEGWWGRERKAT